MIFNELRLHNFGVYKGQHTLKLSPTSLQKPVVLIGALNGSGKTTIIEALHLALYGRQGIPASRRGTSAESYLRSAIHKDVDPAEGASVALRFEMQEAGRSTEYELVRTWSEKNGKVRESFEVFKDGRNDASLSDLWNDHVQDILPSRIAPLFFFDGEKIEELADLNRAPELVREAIKSLLGLDIVSQLETDLEVLERRKFGSLATQDDQRKLRDLEDQLTQLEAKRSAMVVEITECRAEAAKFVIERDRANTAFREAGGDLFQQHESLKAQRGSLESDYQRAQVELRQVAAGVLPIALVRPMLKRAIVQGASELSCAAAEQRYNAQLERDQFVETLIRGELKNEHAADRIVRLLKSDLESKKPGDGRTSYLHVAAPVHAGMQSVENIELPAALDRSRALLIEIAEQDKKLSAFQSKLAAIPDRDTVEGLAGTVSKATAKVHESQILLDQHEKQLAETDRQTSLVQRSLKQLIEQRVLLHGDQADAERIIKYSKFARESLKQFGSLVIRHHIERIETLVEEALRNLFRKENFIAHVKIDPETFEIALRETDGKPIAAELLSAGERQLLATSLLWALAKAAGRQIPTAIDTPLGRLDSVHRQKLVDSYFPRASHQVILLSTDEEISGAYYQMLIPSISHSFTLKYDSATRSSHIEDGYAFCKEGAHVH